MQIDKSQTIGNSSTKYTWSSIFSIDEKDYQECLEWTRRYYQSISSENYSGIINCVKYAIENGNHSAFAHFFLQDKYDQKFVFCEQLNALIEQQEGKDANIEELWMEAPIIKHWRSLSFIKYWRLLNSFKYPPKDTIDPKSTYSKGGKRKWRKGESIPPRDVIVQIGIVLSLTPDETNSLLLAAGESVLYVLDVVDVCSIFALEKYKNNFDIDPKTKLIETKKEIDRVLTDYKKQGVPFIESQNAFQIASNKPFISTIEEDIAKLRGLLEMKEPDKADRLLSDSINTSFLTKYYQGEIKRLIKDNKIADYIKSGNLISTQGNDLHYTNIVFLHKYYGFLKKTRDLLLKSTNYQKNISKDKDEWDLTIKGFTAVKNILYEQQNSTLETDLFCTSEVYEKEIKAAIQTVEKILHTTDIDSHLYPSRGSLSLIRQLAEGRKKNKKNEPQKYQMDLSSHIVLIRFLVATGNEDIIDYYMNLSGMWNKNWYSEYKNAYSCPLEAESLQKDNYLSRADFLILYALLYRDALINKWGEFTGLASPEKERIRTIFPMIKLLLSISQDIVLAFMKLDKTEGSLYGDYDNARSTRYQGGTKDYEDRLLQMMTKELVFPISWYFHEILIPWINRNDEKWTNRQQHLQLNRGENDDLENTPCWKQKIPS